MFYPSITGKQYVVLDERYAYILSQCREACRRLSFGGKGFTGCEMFVLRAPDPVLDPRPAYQARQVCLLLGRREGSEIVGQQNEWPRLVNDPNTLFGYNVERQSEYPPMIVARKI